MLQTLQLAALAFALVALPAAGARTQVPGAPDAVPQQNAGLATALSAAPLIALVDFDFAAVHEWWAAELELGRGVADLIADGLINDGTYRVLERRFIGSVLAEKNLAGGQPPGDPSAAGLAPVGKLLGAQYLIVGSVTKFGLEKQTKGGLGAFFGGGGGIGQEKGKGTVSIAARVVEVSTGEVVASVKVDGISTRTGLLLAGAGPGGFAGFGMGSSKFRETVLGEATEVAVKQAVERLVALKPRLMRQQ